MGIGNDVYTAHGVTTFIHDEQWSLLIDFQLPFLKLALSDRSRQKYIIDSESE